LNIQTLFDCLFLKIDFVTIGESLVRKKREFIDDLELEKLYRDYRQWKTNQLADSLETIFDNSSFRMSFNDTFYRKQWYLVS